MLNEFYLVVTKRLPQMMEAIQGAGVPPRFTYEFLKSLDFKSTNDRGFIGLLKGIGFLDESGVPTEKYKAYKDKTEAKNILGLAIKESYSDLFLASEKANELSVEKLKGIFGTKTGKGDSVVTKMASTFKALCSLSSFDKDSRKKEDIEEKDKDKNEIISLPDPKRVSADFQYNIQIHLPITKDISVYNAIFKSIKDHLL